MRKQKKHLKVDNVWLAIEEQIQKKLDVYLEDSWLKSEVFTPPCHSG